MLETIREFAAERLEESGEADELQRRHAEWFLALAEEAFPNLLGSPGDWLDRLEAEHDNLRAALDRLEGSGDVQSALRLAGAMYRFWFMHGHLREGGRRLEGLLAKAADATPARGRALHGAAAMAMNTGDTATMRARAEEALSFHRERDDEWGIAYAQVMLANAAAEEGDFVTALALYEEARRSFAEVGDQHFAVGLLNSIAHCYGELGDRDRECAIHEEGLRLARLHGNERVAARSLYSLSWCALNDGRPQDSRVLVEEALATYVRLGELPEVSMGLRRFAWALAAEGRAHSTQLLARAEALRDELGVWLEAWVREVDGKTVTAIRDRLDLAAFGEAWEQGKSLTLDEAVALALDEQPA
jgi:non-specific serine/threonine protein kinase